MVFIVKFGKDANMGNQHFTPIKSSAKMIDYNQKAEKLTKFRDFPCFQNREWEFHNREQNFHARAIFFQGRGLFRHTRGWNFHAREKQFHARGIFSTGVAFFATPLKNLTTCVKTPTTGLPLTATTLKKAWTPVEILQTILS